MAGSSPSASFGRVVRVVEFAQPGMLPAGLLVLPPPIGQFFLFSHVLRFFVDAQRAAPNAKNAAGMPRLLFFRLLCLGIVADIRLYTLQLLSAAHDVVKRLLLPKHPASPQHSVNLVRGIRFPRVQYFRQFKARQRGTRQLLFFTRKDHIRTIPEFEDLIPDIRVSKVIQKPLQPPQNASSVGLTQSHNHNTTVALFKVRDCVEEIPVRSEEYGALLLRQTKDRGVLGALLVSSPDIGPFVSARTE